MSSHTPFSLSQVPLAGGGSKIKYGPRTPRAHLSRPKRRFPDDWADFIAEKAQLLGGRKEVMSKVAEVLVRERIDPTPVAPAGKLEAEEDERVPEGPTPAAGCIGQEEEEEAAAEGGRCC